MIDQLTTSLDSSYFRLALLEALFVGIVGGIAGVQVMIRRLPMYVLAVSHATFPGIVIAAIIGIHVSLGAATSAVVIACALYFWGLTKFADGTGLTGVLLSGSFAFGIVLAALGGVGNADTVGYLVGSILSVERADVIIAAGAALGSVLIALGTGKELTFSVFDSVGARAAGLPVGRLDLMTLVAVALAVVVMIPAVGTLLALGLMTVPAMSARLCCDRIRSMTVLSVIISVAGAIGGVLLSAIFEVAVSGLVSMCLAVLFAAALLVRFLRYRRSRRSMRINDPSGLPMIASEV